MEGKGQVSLEHRPKMALTAVKGSEITRSKRLTTVVRTTCYKTVKHAVIVK